MTADERNQISQGIEFYFQVLPLAAYSADGSISDNIGNGRYIDCWVELDGRLVIVEHDYERDGTRAYPRAQNDAATRRPALNGTAFTWPRGEPDPSYRLLPA